MKHRTRISTYIGIIVAVIVLSCAMCACSSQNNADVSEVQGSAEKVIRTVMTYPNTNLYDPGDITYIGEGTETPAEEYDGEAAMLADKDKWEKAIGDCFTDGMFDNFYSDHLSMDFLGQAYSKGYKSAEVTEIVVTDDTDPDDELEPISATLEITLEDNSKEYYVIEWLAKYDKEDSSLLQSLALIDDAGYLGPVSIDEVNVPDLLGMKYEDALQVIKTSNLQLGEATYLEPADDNLVVTIQKPDPGKKVPTGYKIEITLGKEEDDY